MVVGGGVERERKGGGGGGGRVNELRVGSYSHNKEKKIAEKNPISPRLSLSAYNFHSLAFSIESQ